MARPIEALGRGLEVLDSLLRSYLHTCTLDHLHRQTGIPKASLLSILETLRLHGMAEERAGRWALSMEWLWRVHAHSMQRVVELENQRRTAHV